VVQNNAFKEAHTGIGVTVMNWASKVVQGYSRNRQLTIEGKC
jgi:hypothetical protein